MKFFLFTAILAAGSVRASIVEINSITQISSYIDSDTLVIFDLDNTVFEGVGFECHANWYYKHMKNSGGESFPEYKGLFYRSWRDLQKSCDVVFVEEETRPVLEGLQSKNIRVLALTARDGGMRKETLAQISSLNISFSRTALSSDACGSLDKSNGETLFCEGVLFASPSIPKGDVLKAYFDKFGYKPQKIVFVDDLRKNLNDVERSFPSINFMGLHYPLVEIRNKI